MTARSMVYVYFGRTFVGRLCVGFDSGDAVSGEYETPGTFHGGTIQAVGVTVEPAAYSDLEQEARRALTRD